MNVALFGFMGVGKSAVGRMLAEKLGLSFVDLDEEIVSRTGRSIESIFQEDGEERFREIERAVTKEYSAFDGQVIACGGGTVIDPENLENLRRSSRMVLLTAEAEVILERVEAEGGVRPLLNVDDRLGKIRSLLTKRWPSYVEAADIIIDTSEYPPHVVVSIIIENLE
ncbi:shikimate kinase [Candidatus Bathyarchaeota archaeon]|nr:shikimate kinase [Candidatus Bathyarchaeota archaeon]